MHVFYFKDLHHILLCCGVSSFKTSKNDHIIEVQLYDDIDFVCPYYPAKSSSSSTPEYYTIYMVGSRVHVLFYIHIFTYRPLHQYISSIGFSASEVTTLWLYISSIIIIIIIIIIIRNRLFITAIVDW